jgi:predicted Fe-Mo cluster-binding NifX family protein
MRVAISVDNGKGLDSVVSPHFGRCPYYILIDLDGQEVSQVSAVKNPYYSKQSISMERRAICAMYVSYHN